MCSSDLGYTLPLDGLPEGELEFSLCASERPVGEFPSHRNYILRQLVIPLILLVVLLTGCILLGVFLYRRKHIRKSR